MENNDLILLHVLVRLGLMVSPTSFVTSLSPTYSVSAFQAKRRKGVSRLEDNFGEPLYYWCSFARQFWNMM